jgi:predicted nuclease of predicted toxin-antitoxin system
MRFKIDENLHRDVAALLRSAGHEVQTVHDEGLRGAADGVIIQHCQAESRSLVTLDLDFADIRTYPPGNQAGLIVLRVSNQSRQHILRVLSPIVPLLKEEPIAGRLWIVSETGIRIRR